MDQLNQVGYTRKRGQRRVAVVEQRMPYENLRWIDGIQPVKMTVEDIIKMHLKDPRRRSVPMNIKGEPDVLNIKTEPLDYTSNVFENLSKFKYPIPMKIKVETEDENQLNFESNEIANNLQIQTKGRAICVSNTPACALELCETHIGDINVSNTPASAIELCETQVSDMNVSNTPASAIESSNTPVDVFSSINAIKSSETPKSALEDSRDQEHVLSSIDADNKILLLTELISSNNPKPINFTKNSNFKVVNKSMLINLHDNNRNIANHISDSADSEKSTFHPLDLQRLQADFLPSELLEVASSNSQKDKSSSLRDVVKSKNIGDGDTPNLADKQATPPFLPDHDKTKSPSPSIKSDFTLATNSSSRKIENVKNIHSELNMNASLTNANRNAIATENSSEESENSNAQVLEITSKCVDGNNENTVPNISCSVDSQTIPLILNDFKALLSTSSSSKLNETGKNCSNHSFELSSNSDKSVNSEDNREFQVDKIKSEPPDSDEYSTQIRSEFLHEGVLKNVKLEPCDEYFLEASSFSDNKDENFTYSGGIKSEPLDSDELPSTQISLDILQDDNSNNSKIDPRDSKFDDSDVVSDSNKYPTNLNSSNCFESNDPESIPRSSEGVMVKNNNLLTRDSLGSEENRLPLKKIKLNLLKETISSSPDSYNEECNSVPLKKIVFNALTLLKGSQTCSNSISNENVLQGADEPHVTTVPEFDDFDDIIFASTKSASEVDILEKGPLDLYDFTNIESGEPMIDNKLSDANSFHEGKDRCKDKQLNNKENLSKSELNTNAETKGLSASIGQGNKSAEQSSKNDHFCDQNDKENSNTFKFFNEKYNDHQFSEGSKVQVFPKENASIHSINKIPRKSRFSSPPNITNIDLRNKLNENQASDASKELVIPKENSSIYSKKRKSRRRRPRKKIKGVPSPPNITNIDLRKKLNEHQASDSSKELVLPKENALIYSTNKRPRKSRFSSPLKITNFDLRSKLNEHQTFVGTKPDLSNVNPLQSSCSNKPSKCMKDQDSPEGSFSGNLCDNGPSEGNKELALSDENASNNSQDQKKSKQSSQTNSNDYGVKKKLDIVHCQSNDKTDPVLSSVKINDLLGTPLSLSDEANFLRNNLKPPLFPDPPFMSPQFFNGHNMHHNVYMNHLLREQQYYSNLIKYQNLCKTILPVQCNPLLKQDILSSILQQQALNELVHQQILTPIAQQQIYPGMPLFQPEINPVLQNVNILPQVLPHISPEQHILNHIPAVNNTLGVPIYSDVPTTVNIQHPSLINTGLLNCGSPLVGEIFAAPLNESNSFNQESTMMSLSKNDAEINRGPNYNKNLVEFKESIAKKEEVLQNIPSKSTKCRSDVDSNSGVRRYSKEKRFNNPNSNHVKHNANETRKNNERILSNLKELQRRMNKPPSPENNKKLQSENWKKWKERRSNNSESNWKDAKLPHKKRRRDESHFNEEKINLRIKKENIDCTAFESSSLDTLESLRKKLKQEIDCESDNDRCYEKFRKDMRDSIRRKSSLDSRPESDQHFNFPRRKIKDEDGHLSEGEIVSDEEIS